MTYWRIQFGSSPGVYTDDFIINDENAREASLDDFLPDSGVWYVIVLAGNDDGESPASNEVQVCVTMSSPSVSPSASKSPSTSTSPSLSPSASVSPSASQSPSASGSASASPSSSLSPSPSVTPSASKSPSASASPSIAEENAAAWGEQNPDEGETAVTWQQWESSPGVTSLVSGDLNWGRLQVTDGTPDYGPVVDRGETSEKVFTVTLNKYGTGVGAVNVFIRGSEASFGQHDASPDWLPYSAPVQDFWRYIQVKAEEAV